MNDKLIFLCIEATRECLVHQRPVCWLWPTLWDLGE